jgi:hypothetical protein
MHILLQYTDYDAIKIICLLAKYTHNHLFYKLSLIFQWNIDLSQTIYLRISNA